MATFLDQLARSLGHLNYKHYLSSPHWKDFSTKVRGIKCFCCERQGCELHVHHITYERLGREEGNDVVTVCHECHSDIHFLASMSSCPLYAAHYSVKEKKEREKSLTAKYERYEKYKEVSYVTHWMKLANRTIHQTITELGYYLRVMGLLDERYVITEKAYWLRIVKDIDKKTLWDVARYWKLYKNDRDVHKYVHQEFRKYLLCLEQGETSKEFNIYDYPKVFYPDKKLHPKVRWGKYEELLPRSLIVLKSDGENKKDAWMVLWKFTFKPVFASVEELKSFLRVKKLYSPYENCGTEKAYKEGYVRKGSKGDELWNVDLLLEFMGFSGRKEPHKLKENLTDTSIKTVKIEKSKASVKKHDKKVQKEEKTSRQQETGNLYLQSTPKFATIKVLEGKLFYPHKIKCSSCSRQFSTLSDLTSFVCSKCKENMRKLAKNNSKRK